MGRDSGPGDYRHSVVSKPASEAFRKGWGNIKWKTKRKRAREKAQVWPEGNRNEWEPEVQVTAHTRESFDE